MNDKKLVAESIWIYDDNSNRVLCTSLVKQTEKAFGIIVDRGDYVVKESTVWIPKSVAKISIDKNYKAFADQKESEYAILYKVTLPNWVIRKNNIK